MGHKAEWRWLVVLAASGCAAQPTAPTRIAAPRAVAAPVMATRAVATAAMGLAGVMLAGHNAARAAVGVAPLSWDPALAQAAADHARTMARTGRFAHAEQRGDPLARQGENLWAGTRGAYRAPEMIGLWVDERRDFVDAPAPAFSRTGRWQDVGHYTQIVARRTTRVGCALASGAAEDYLVCRYAPAGNVWGQRVF